MTPAMWFHVFRYTKYYHKMQANELCSDLFNDEGFQKLFKVAQKKGEPLPLHGKVTSIDVSVVPATLTRCVHCRRHAMVESHINPVHS